jgi:hypothetical protein
MRSTRRLLTLVLLAATVLVAAAIATAGSTNSPTAAAEDATKQFKDVSVALAAGYGEFRDAQGIACIDNPGVGAMGIHYVNGSLVGDTVLDPTRPEALVYDPRGSGNQLKLVALEYIVFAEPWDATHLEPPSMFGREFDFTPSPNRYGIPAFYALHAWLFKNNRAGELEPWNPKVFCD